MRRPLVAANWKMHGQKAQISALLQALVSGLADADHTDILLCPAFVFLGSVQKALSATSLWLGAQNMHQDDEGAFTGEVSGRMLQEFACTHVIVGHSERRTLFGETNELVASKFQQAQRLGLVPLLCVGESEGQRAQGITAEVVKAQLDAVTRLCGNDAYANAVIAYEPVWAIGTGVTATPKQAQDVHAMIRAELGKLDSQSVVGGKCAQTTRILYGGSVKADNAAELFAQTDIDGALVGGASLVAEEFIAICRSFV